MSRGSDILNIDIARDTMPSGIAFPGILPTCRPDSDVSEILVKDEFAQVEVTFTYPSDIVVRLAGKVAGRSLTNPRLAKDKDWRLVMDAQLTVLIDPTSPAKLASVWVNETDVSA